MQFLLFDHTEIQEFLHLMVKKEGKVPSTMGSFWPCVKSLTKPHLEDFLQQNAGIFDAQGNDR